MAKAISDEELQLKKRARRRLVGAIALVLLVVVFLPMFLDSEPKPLSQDIAITIPPLPDQGSAAQSAPTSAAPVPKAVQPVPSANEAAPSRPQPVPEPKTVAPTLQSRPETRVEPRPAPIQQAKADETFVVQLGAFSNSANAKALQRKLQENKFKAYTELVKSSAGDRTRVRVGPYASRDAAEKARDRMKAMKLVIGEAAVVRQGD
jgi:DedD protein